MKRGKGLWATVKAVVERILDLDQFWWLWATTVVGVTVGLRVFGGGPFAPAAGFAAIPLFLGGIGLTSIVYALVIELLLHREVVEPTDDDCTPPRVRSMRPRGEAMIPAALGLALTVFSIFLGLAIARRELTILVVGLPLVLVFAPTFVLFAFGYWRGEPTVGAFGYRAMPWGFGAFVALAILVLVGRKIGAPMAGDGLLLPSVIAVIVGLAFLASFYRATHPPEEQQ